MPTLRPNIARGVRTILAVLLVPSILHLAGLAIAQEFPGEAEAGKGSLCGCDVVSYCPPPRFPWYFRTEGVGLRRDVLRDTPVALQAVDLGPPPIGWFSLYADACGKPFKGGPRFVGGHTFGDSPYQVEMSYFWLDEWDAAAGLHDATGSLFSPFTHFGNPVPDITVDFNNSVQIREISRLDSGELNLKQFVPTPSLPSATLAFLFGVRYLAVREEFDYSSLPSLTLVPVSVNTRTHNTLWGPQIGVQLEIAGGNNVWLSADAKGALCNNYAYRDLDANIATTDYNHGRLSQNGTAYVADFSLSATWRPFPMLTARAGYQALWVGGLVLAAENFHPDLASIKDLTTDPPLDRQGKVLYHGPFAGLQLNW